MNIFDSVQSNAPKRNKFDLSHERKMSLKMGDLVPIMVQEIVPGDKFRVSSETLMRFAPMLAPIMHRIDTTIHYFFVPNRLVWSEWESFITGGPDGTSAPIHPTIPMNQSTRTYFPVGSLPDYMGIPTIAVADPTISIDTQINALPFRAYAEIYNTYYRDQNLETAIAYAKGSGIMTSPETLLLTTLRKRAWEKDYFTSSLPWAQRGPSSTVPVTGTVGVGTFRTGDVRKSSDNTLAATGALTNTTGVMQANGVPAYQDVIGTGTLNGGAMDIQNLRRTVRLQQWLERNATGGARYIEQILMHFGIKSSDARLQRPEYLGGGKTPIQVSEVLSTFQENGGTIPQANMAGHGIGVGKSNQFSKQFEEHGFVIGIMSILPRTAYQQGIPKKFLKADKFDYFWPEFANLGEQPIQNQELYWQTNQSQATREGTFGYQSRYANYKYEPSTVHGVMRTTNNFWHAARIFAAMPVLNASFVQSDPTTRMFAVSQTEQIYCQVYNKIDAIRPMPYYGTPSL